MTSAYFYLCSAVGWLLRSAKYSKATLHSQHGRCEVLKRRRFYAPLLVWMSAPLMRVMDTGVRVLPQREWHDREQRLYRNLHDLAVHVNADGTLVLPCLAGRTLASLLEDQTAEESERRQGIALAATALAAFHRAGFTHGDAMAENVLIEARAGVARWFDFETVHEMNRPAIWRRADDLRALLVTCLVRTAREKHAETLQLIIDNYADGEVTWALGARFSSVWQRALTFELAQAPLSFESFEKLERFFHLFRIPSDSLPGAAPVID